MNNMSAIQNLQHKNNGKTKDYPTLVDTFTYYPIKLLKNGIATLNYLKNKT